jgi:hypothetical protein
VFGRQETKVKLVAHEPADVFSAYPWTRVEWTHRAEALEPGSSRFQRLRRTLVAARKCDVVVLDAFAREDVVAAVLIARTRNPPQLLILYPTWKLDKAGLLGVATRAVVRMLDGPHVRYGVFSRFELESFPKSWSVGSDRVIFVPWHFDLSEDELEAAVTTSGPFFAGGDSLRDYLTLLAAASTVPAQVVVATRAEGVAGGADRAGERHDRPAKSCRV